MTKPKQHDRSPLHSALLCALLSLLAISAAHAKTLAPLVLKDTASPFPLKPHLYHLNAGPDSSLDPLYFNQLFTRQYSAPNPGAEHSAPSWQTTPYEGSVLYTQDHHWFLAEIHNRREHAEPLVIHYGTALSVTIDVYLIRDNAVVAHFRRNKLEESTSWDHSRYHAFPVDLAPGARYRLLVHSTGAVPETINGLSIQEKDAFLQQVNERHITYWLHYGIMLVIFVASLALALAMRSPIFFYYALFVLSATLFYFQTHWPGSSLSTVRLSLIIVLASVISRQLFVDALLHLRETLPGVHNLNMFYIGTGIIVICLAASVPISSAYNISLVFMLLGIPAQLILFGASLVLWRRGNMEAGIYCGLFISFLLLTATPLIISMVEPSYTSDSQLYSRLGETLLASGLLGILLRRIGKLKLEEKLARAESEAKGEFVARMSHELRTPMTGVLGLTDLLMETKQNAVQQRYTQMIRECGNALLAVINDILDVSKIAAGKMEITTHPTDTRQLLLNAASIFAAKARQNDLEFVAHIHADVPARINADEAHIRQILLNLVGNAFKFTDQGEIEIAVTREENGRDLIVFSVRDTGIGITQETQKKLFDPFVQADSSTSRTYGGTGLGLSISRQLAQLMGGDITVSSEPESGSLFRFSLPCQPCKKTNGAPHRGDAIADPTQLKNQTVLLFSNSSCYLRLAQHCLEDAGATVECFSNAALIPKALSSRPVDLVLIDIHHSEAVAGQIEQWLNAGLIEAEKILVLSSQLSEISRRQLKTLPSIDTLERPIIVRDLIEPVARRLCPDNLPQASEASDEQRAGQLTAASPPLNILLAEDNTVNQTVFRAMLEKLGHNVTCADNGAEALEFYENGLSNKRCLAFDLILMDCQMPRLDGYDATRKIRALERQRQLQAIPILALSADTTDEHKQRCMSCGMNAALTKPIKLHDLNTHLATLFGEPGADRQSPTG